MKRPISLLISGLVLSAGFILIYVYVLRDSPSPPTVSPPSPTTISRMSGLLTAPVETTESVAGVTLTVGDTAINTSETGQFVFTALPATSSLSLQHPSLPRSISFRGPRFATSSVLTIPFSVSLYTALAQAVTPTTSDPLTITAIEVGRYTSPSRQQHLDGVYSFHVVTADTPTWYRLQYNPTAASNWEVVE